MKNRLIALLLVIFTAGCVQAPEPNRISIKTEAAVPASSKDPDSAVPVTPVNGGTLKLSMRLPLTLNPLLNEDASVAEVFKLLYEPIAYYDENLKPVPNPAIVEYVNFSFDYKSVILTLKSGLVWSDGSPINSKDLLYSLETLKSNSAVTDENSETVESNAYYESCGKMISTFSEVSDTAVKIEFTKSSCGQLYALMFPVIPAKIADGDLRIRRSAEGLPKTNGIYKYTEYVPSEKLMLAASDSALREKPYIDILEITITKDHATDLMCFEHRLVDTAYGDLSEWSVMTGRADMRADGFPSTYFDFIGFNFSKTLFRQNELREAIAMCVPYEKLISEIYVNRAFAAQTPIPSYSWLYSPDLEEWKYSRQEAVNLLYDSGFSDADHNGVYEKPVVNEDNTMELIEMKLSILYNEENALRGKIAAILKDELESIGFVVEILKMPFDEYTARLEDGDFDIYIGGIRFSENMPDFRFMFSAEPFVSGVNYGSYASEELEGILNGIDNAQNEDELKNAYSAFQKHVVKNLPVLGFAFRQDALFNGGNLYNCEKIGCAGVYYNMNNWFIGR